MSKYIDGIALDAVCSACGKTWGHHYTQEQAIKIGSCIFQGGENEMAKEVKVEVVNSVDELKTLAAQYAELNSAYLKAQAAYQSVGKEVNSLNTKKAAVIAKIKPLFASGDANRSLVVGDIVINNIGGNFYVTTLVK